LQQSTSAAKSKSQQSVSAAKSKSQQSVSAAKSKSQQSVSADKDESQQSTSADKDESQQSAPTRATATATVVSEDGKQRATATATAIASNLLEAQNKASCIAKFAASVRCIMRVLEGAPASQPKLVSIAKSDNDTGVVMNPTWRASNTEGLLRLFHHILKGIENNPKARKFHLCPVADIRRHHISIDNKAARLLL